MMFNFLRKRKQNEIQRMIQNGVLEDWLDKKIEELNYEEILDAIANNEPIPVLPSGLNHEDIYEYDNDVIQEETGVRLDLVARMIRTFR